MTITDTASSALGRQMALVAGTLYGSAALLVGISLLAAWDAHTRPGLVAGVAGVGLAVGLGYLAVAARVEVPPWTHVVTAALGSVLVGVLVVAAGPTFAAVYGLLLAYVVAFSLFYFSLPVATGQVTFAALVYGLALARLDPPLPRLSYWVVVIGAATVGSGLVGLLGHRARQLLEREQATAERLAELDRRKDAYVRVVAHDIRSPLVNIIGGAETIERHLHELDPDTVRDLARRQAAQGRRLDRIARNLLDVERLRSRALHPQREPVRVDELVRSLLEATELGETLVRIDDTPAEVPADPAMLERAVENLVTNALRHTPAGEAVDVRVWSEGDEVCLAVEDRGPGVPASDREAIFELYRSDEGGGTSGVGLALVREVVSAHGGRAWVEDRPGGGASFRLALPAAGEPGRDDR